MAKVAEIAIAIPASRVPAKPTDDGSFAAIVLFSGIGLLVSLIAILSGVQGSGIESGT
jgi:hypothetical protein